MVRSVSASSLHGNEVSMRSKQIAALREQNKIAFQLLASGAYFCSTQDIEDRTSGSVSLELRWLFAPAAGFRPFLGAGYAYSQARNTRAGLAMFGFVIAWD